MRFTKKYEKAKTNILRYTKYVGKIKVTDDLKRKIEQYLKFFAFRLTELYEYEFPPGLTKIQINLDDFYLPQQTYQFRFNISYFELEGAFNGNLKNLFKSTRNISNASESVPTPPNLEEIFVTDAEKELLSKKFSPILKRIDIVQDSFFIYGKSNFIKKTFITELNNYIPLYGAISYFDKKEEKN